jgi:hypothetical protein
VPVRDGSGLQNVGSGFILRAQVFAGLAWFVDWGLDCRLCPKTRPARALDICCKSLIPSPHVGPGPDTALVPVICVHVRKKCVGKMFVVK